MTTAANLSDVHAFTELTLYIENTSAIYSMLQAVHANLMKKKKRGVYDNKKAVKAFYNVANRAAKMYCVEFNCGTSMWYETFPTDVRKATAMYLRDQFETMG